MTLSEKQFDWADDVLIDVITDSNNPNAEKARKIMVMLAATAFELQQELDKLKSTQPA